MPAICGQARATKIARSSSAYPELDFVPPEASSHDSMPYLGVVMSSEAAKPWQTAIKNALLRGVTVERLEPALRKLKERYPLHSTEIAAVLLSFRASVGSADDPLLFGYIRLFLKTNCVNTADVLTALLRTSTYGPANDGDPGAVQRLGLPSCEEKIFGLLTQIHLNSALPLSTWELYQLVDNITDWLRVISQYETRKQLEGAGLHHVDWFSCGIYEALGSLAISVFENAGFREANKHKWWKERRPTVVREMENYDAHVLQWTQSQLSGRLRNLAGMPPFMGTDDKGRPLFTDQQVLDAIPQVPAAHSRAGLFLWLNAALAARPLTDDMNVLSYLHARYPGNVQSLIVDLLVAAFDNLTNSNLRKEPRQVKVIRSFICNKVPILISMLSGSIAPPMTAEACIQMALVPGGLISMNPLPPISAGASDVQESLKNTRLEFLQACALHGLVTENTIATILHESIALPRVAKYNKDALVSQCGNNISRMEALIDDLGGMQGNAGAIAGCVVQTIGNLCMSKDTMSLKTVCNELIKRIPSLDVIMQYTEPGQLLLPLCNLLDGWVHEQDQTEFTPSYEEFASVLLLTLAVIHRYNIQSPDLDLLGDNFIARLLDEMSSSKPPLELPEEHGSQLAKWIEGLFAVDEHGETSGIGDDVMRQCSPRDFYLLVPTLFEQSVLACRCNALSLESFKGGLELLLEPFLLPSLVMGLGWLAEHSWEDHNDVEVLLQVLEKLLKPSSSSQETQAMHRAILSMVATPLYNSLQELLRKRPDKKKATELSALLKPFLNQQRNLHCSRIEMDEWMRDGTLKDRVRHSIRDLVRWASTTTSPPDPPPKYAHRMFALACQLVDTDMLLDTIVDELASTPFANMPVALDVCTAMICAPAAGSMSQQRNHSSGVTARLRNKVRLVPSDVRGLLEKPKAHAQALVQLSRQVESQLAIAQLPPMAMPMQLQEQAADQMMQDLGLELPADIANVAPDGKLDLTGLEQQMDLSNANLSNANLSNATVRQLESMAADTGAMDLDQAQMLGNLNMDLKNDQQLNLTNQEEDIFAGLDMEMNGLGDDDFNFG